jgi:hypothetical protein
MRGIYATVADIYVVIASQRVRPEVAGPMAGSAKQSSYAAKGGLLRRQRSSQ